MPVLHAVLMGTYARTLLNASVKGDVLAAVSSAIYLQTHNDEILWIGKERMPHHRRGIQLDRWNAWSERGSTFHVSGSTLYLGSDWQIKTADAVSWCAPEIDLSLLLPIRGVTARWIEFCRSYKPPRSEGFSALIGLIKNTVLPASFPADLYLVNPSELIALPVIKSMIDCCLKRDLVGVLHHGQGLIGLGCGLTPSGDDFLGGLLFTINTLRHLYIDELRFLTEDLQPWLETAKSRTHPISYALLQDHAAGSGVEALHHFVYSFFRQGSTEAILKYARQLENLGHSSGMDLIAGVLMAMLMTFNSEVISWSTSGSQHVPTMESRR
jgi:hypothetical protein